MSKPVITNKIYIPAKKIDPTVLQQNFEVQSYDESVCQRCPIYKKGERHSDDCDACPAYKGITQLWNEIKVKGKQYIGLPPGQPTRIENLFSLSLANAVDLRPEIPFSQPIKFIGKLYDGSVIDGRQTVNQKQVVADWLAKKTGIINCAPRSGKTVMGIYVACELGLKTIIVANKRTLLEQFKDTILGSKVRKAVTNAKKTQDATGKVRVKIIEKMSDFKGADIALVPYQKFIRNAKSRARIKDYINDTYSLLILDEAHGAGAMAYLGFISRLKCKYRLALSATPIRKDGADRLLRSYVGGVVAKSSVVAKIPTIELVETGVHVKNPYRLWVYAMKHLAGHKERNKLIVRDVFADLRKKYHSIIIPVDYVQHGETLVKMINRQAQVNNIKRGEAWNEPLAVFFSASLKKSPKKMQEILNSVDSGKHQVLVAVRSMVKEGVDLSRPEILYNIVPCSGTKEAGSPLMYQLANRIGTWHKDKKQPILRLYLDGMGQSIGCLKSLWWNELYPGLRDSNERKAKYLIADAERDRVMKIVKDKSYVPPNQPGERVYSKDLIKDPKRKPLSRRSFSSF